MTLNDEFLEVFKYLQKKQKTFKLLNVYKGMPISSTSEVLYVGKHSIIVNASESQFVCMHGSKNTYIYIDILPRAVLADVEATDILASHVALRNFRYVSDGIGKRKDLRVKPEIPLSGILESVEKNAIIGGIIEDISRSGLSLIINQTEFPGVLFNRGAPVNTYFRLPGIVKKPRPTSPLLDKPYEPASYTFRPDIYSRFENLEKNLFGQTTNLEHLRQHRIKKPSSFNPDLELIGKIANIRIEILKGKHRVGIQLANQHTTNALIVSFVNKRQSEIIREIRGIYQELLDQAKKEKKTGS